MRTVPVPSLAACVARFQVLVSQRVRVVQHKLGTAMLNAWLAKTIVPSRSGAGVRLILLLLQDFVNLLLQRVVRVDWGNWWLTPLRERVSLGAPQQTIPVTLT